MIDSAKALKVLEELHQLNQTHAELFNERKQLAAQMDRVNARLTAADDRRSQLERQLAEIAAPPAHEHKPAALPLRAKHTEDRPAKEGSK